MMYEIMIRVDTNDGDYDTNIREISEEDLEKLRPLLSAINNFKPYKVKKKGLTWEYKHNWSSGECFRGDLGEKSPAELYPDFDEEFLEWFEEFLPAGSEFGFHTIDLVEVYPLPEKEILVERR